MIDPLSAYLLSVLKREATCRTYNYVAAEEALHEMGYWCLDRPATYERSQMPPTGISVECKFIEEFPSYYPESFGCAGFDVIIEVYADSRAADLTTGQQ